MQGTNIDFIKEIASQTNKPLTAAGGISTIEEIVELEKNNISCQLGMSIYTGKINLEEAFCACLDFEKQQGLIPTIVQDKMTKQVLMLAYSNIDSLKKSFETGKCTYFSRSRNSASSFAACSSFAFATAASTRLVTSPFTSLYCTVIQINNPINVTDVNDNAIIAISLIIFDKSFRGLEAAGAICCIIGWPFGAIDCVGTFVIVCPTI
jgi:hypothetical protein